MATLEKLVKRRAYVKGRITTMSRWADSYSSTTNRVSEIEVMLRALERYRIDFKELQDQIDDCPDASFDEQQRERAEFEDNVIRVEAHLRELQSLAMAAGHTSQGTATRSDSRATTTSTDSNARATIRLPEIKLNTFDGEWENWLNFKNVFTELIHNNSQLTDAQRFYYLQSYVIAGSAKQYIDLPITAENYVIAWKQLQDHFDNESRIVKKHVKGLYELKVAQEGSAQSLQTLIDGIWKNFHALKALKQPVDQWDALLSHLILTKLDSKTRGEVERVSPSDRLQTFRELMKVLADRVRILEAVSSTESSKMKPKPSKSSKSLVATATTQCPICKGDHSVFKCKLFIDMSPQLRVEAVRKHSLCFNCLASSHTKQNCKAGSCRVCHKRHHTLLHFKSTANPNESNPQASTDAAPSSEVTTLNAAMEIPIQAAKACSLHINSESQTEQVLLASAIVIVYDDYGREYFARALLDGCSQFSFMTERLRQLLHLKGKRQHFKVTGINCTKAATNTSVNATIKSRLSDFKASSEFLVTDKITSDLPQQRVNMNVFQIPSHVKLADPQFNVPNKIDILIGADIFWDLLTGETLTTHPEQPKLHGTHLGFVIGGKVITPRQAQPLVSLTCVVDNVQEQVHKFWQQEELPNKDPLSQEELECERHYQEHTTRDGDGRYTVMLPFKSNVQELSDTREAALRQFLRLEQRLEEDYTTRQMYLTFMEEYINLQHAELVTNDRSEDSQIAYYMPHHHVLKPDSSSTKLRVVFNASFRINPKLSLNDILKVGPTIQTDSFSLVLRFRKHIYGLTADLSKMYRQIKVHKSQRSLQTIWWRDTKTGKLSSFQLTTVTYGTACASFLATRTVKQLALDESTSFPSTAKVVLNDVYVDDVMSGAATREELVTLQAELIQLMKRGGFNIHKWASNCKNVPFTQLNAVDLVKTERKQILGLIWETESDHFVIPLNLPDEQKTHTKRQLLSAIMKLYDPLGICAPIIFMAKCMLQELWKVPNLRWDDELPISIQRQWSDFRDQLAGEIRVPRCIRDQSSVRFELHGFGDASERGYGCCLYVRTTTAEQCITVHLLCAKSRVAPLKRATIPRLELSAALLLAELTHKVVSAMNIEFQKITLWTDSTITLYRIRSSPARFSTFVANRIVRLQELTTATQWRHIPGVMNPADLVSRGCSPNDLKLCTVWFEGPEFLKADESDWPPDTSQHDEIEIVADPEFKKQSNQVVCAIVSRNSWTRKYSNLNRLLRVTSWIMRFIHNCKKTLTARTLGPLQASELSNALQIQARLAQEEDFQRELNQLRTNTEPVSKNHLTHLRPFLDHRNVLRVSGRLCHAEMSEDQRHPILLSAKNPLSTLLARHYHQANLHAGPQALLYTLRQQFWIIGGRSLSRKIVYECVKCFRAKPRISNQLMGQLPSARVNQTRPFLKVGLDFCGPFSCKPRVRSKIVLKTYICVFICFVTKAVHLEVVTDLTTDAFLAALRRFVSRRGRCSDIFSDNATNFVGADRSLRELRNLFQTEQHISTWQNACANEGITWHTIPPNSPHFGGLWEAAVKAAKYHLKRALGSTSFTTEELMTIAAQTEACLNSRPITQMSSDPADLEALTPGHFIIGAPLNAIPEPSLLDIKLNRLSRWQLMQRLLQMFWKRWSSEYLTELQTRVKWRRQEESLKVGSMVLLKEDQLPPMKWSLGRIVEVHPGTDGLVRVVSVKTAHGIYKRSITKICPLPTNS